jgi:hypothetical protein
MKLSTIRLFLERRRIAQLIVFTELFAFLMVLVYIYATDGAPLHPVLDSAFVFVFILLLFGSPFAWAAYGFWRRNKAMRRDAASGMIRTKAGGKGDSSSAWGFLILVVLVLVSWGASFVATWLFPESAWAYEWQAFYDTELKDATISIERLPHDCDFFTAPLGSKNCHFEKNLVTVRIRGNGSQRLVSVDEGKTWTAASSSNGAAVYISWTKVLD